MVLPCKASCLHDVRTALPVNLISHYPLVVRMSKYAQAHRFLSGECCTCAQEVDL